MSLELTIQAQQFLDALSEHYGVPRLVFDVEGKCLLSTRDKHILTLAAQLDDLRSIILHTVVGVIDLADETANSLLRDLLSANVGWERTLGATMGMDKDTGVVTLWQRFVLPAVSTEEITDTVDLFLNTARNWREELAESQCFTLLGF